VSEIASDIISMDLMVAKEVFATKQDGFQAIQQLKLDDLTKDIPVMVLTNFFEESKVQKAKEFGAVDFITVSSQAIQKIPEHYLEYAENPKHYKPSHPIFREG
jgi:CheY-like chemotaxis protein